MRSSPTTDHRRRPRPPPIPTAMIPGPWVFSAVCGDLRLPPAVRAAFVADEGTADDPAAVAVCEGCPVAEPCADYAQRLRVLAGIWGGRRRRPRGAGSPEPRE